MQSVLSRSLEIYQRGHFGRVPQKITIHKNTQFKALNGLKKVSVGHSLRAVWVSGLLVLGGKRNNGEKLSLLIDERVKTLQSLPYTLKITI